MKQKIYFALIMALFTGSIVSFVTLSFNLGFTSNFLTIWLRTFGIAYIAIVPCILLIGPKVQQLVGVLLKERNL